MGDTARRRVRRTLRAASPLVIQPHLPHLHLAVSTHALPAHCCCHWRSNRKPSPYSITERRVPELIAVLGSQHAGDVSRKPGGSLPLLSARPAVTLATLKRAATNFAAW